MATLKALQKTNYAFRVLKHFTPVVKDGRSEGWKEWRMEGVKDGRSEGWKEWRMEGVKDGRSEGRKEWRMEGVKDGSSEGRKEWRTEGVMGRKNRALNWKLTIEHVKCSSIPRKMFWECWNFENLFWTTLIFGGRSSNVYKDNKMPSLWLFVLLDPKEQHLSTNMEEIVSDKIFLQTEKYELTDNSGKVPTCECRC